MSAIARPRSGGGVAAGWSGWARPVDLGLDAAASAAGPGSGPYPASGSAPRPAVDSHQDVVVCVGRAAGPTGSAGGGPTGSAGGGSAGAAGSAAVSAAGTLRSTGLPGGHGRAGRRARAWYSGPCLRGSAYSFGLSVQYVPLVVPYQLAPRQSDRKSTRLNSSHTVISYAVFCLKKKKKTK